MKLARIKTKSNPAPQVVALIGEKLVALPAWKDISTLLAAGQNGLAQAESEAAAAAAQGKYILQTDVEFLAPTVPGAYMGMGYNYKTLATHEGVGFNKHPELFAKFPNSAIGHKQPVRVPRVIDKVDYEAELGVVIGRKASRVSAKDALSYVGGYVPVNDLTAKIIPRPPESGSIIIPLKAVDGFGPFGPFLITSDEIENPHDLTLICRVNGVEKQRFKTDDMVHTIEQTIEYITARITLNPGDIIATGTSMGIGIIQKPPLFLNNGDLMEIEIEGYPVLENRIEWETA